MKIVILGAGNTGSYAASVLSQEEHDITLIDRDLSVLDRIGRETDIATIYSSMPDLAVLSNIAETKPDLFFAATDNDETNLISCSLAKNLGIPKTAARIKSRSFLQSNTLDISRLFYVDHFIGADILSAHDLFNLLMHSSDVAFEHFANGAILMRTIKVPPEWKKSDVSIKDLRLPHGLIAGLIRRGDTVLFPHGHDFILVGDEVTLIGEAELMNELHDLFPITEKRIRSVILIGGNEIAFHLASLLLEQGVSVRILEKRTARCRELADLLPQATILNREVKSPPDLIEENIDSTDALIACTSNEGTNFLLSSMAAYLNCPKPIALVGDPAFIPLFKQSKVTPAISSRVNIANRLMAILHEESIVSVGSISNDSAKIVELKVAPSSPLIGIPLSDLHLPKDLLIAVIENHGKVMIGKGSSILCPDDTVIAICSGHCLELNHHLFQ